MYCFERQQYHEFRKLRAEGKGRLEGENAGDVCGAETCDQGYESVRRSLKNRLR